MNWRSHTRQKGSPKLNGLFSITTSSSSPFFSSFYSYILCVIPIVTFAHISENTNCIANESCHTVRSKQKKNTLLFQRECKAEMCKSQQPPKTNTTHDAMKTTKIKLSKIFRTWITITKTWNSVILTKKFSRTRIHIIYELKKGSYCKWKGHYFYLWQNETKKKTHTHKYFCVPLNRHK